MTDHARPFAELQDIQQVLAGAGYHSVITPLGRFSRVLLAESPYALVAVFEVEDWNAVVKDVADIQAELTRIAAEADQSSIRWDLYVLAHVRAAGLQAIPAEIVDLIESDTKYARKFLRANLSRDPQHLDRALRPLLPLRPTVVLEVVDPLDLLHTELIAQGISDELATATVDSFRRTGSVRVR